MDLAAAMNKKAAEEKKKNKQYNDFVRKQQESKLKKQ